MSVIARRERVIAVERASKSHEMMRLLGLLALFAGSALGSSGFAETPSATVDLRITNAD